MFDVRETQHTGYEMVFKSTCEVHQSNSSNNKTSICSTALFNENVISVKILFLPTGNT